MSRTAEDYEWVRVVSPGGPGWWHRRLYRVTRCGLDPATVEVGDGAGPRCPKCWPPGQLEPAEVTP